MKTISFKLLIVLATVYSYIASSQCTFTSNVPYAVNFGTTTANNQLPICWSASDLGGANLTFSGSSNSGYAAFSSTPAGTSYFYTNGIQLYPGITYSIGMTYMTLVQSAGFSSFGIALGTSQSSVGMLPVITSTNFGPPGLQLNTTMTVSSPGVYYLGIWATGTGATTQPFRLETFDIHIPCTYAGNSPTITINPPAINVCPNEIFTLTASGADHYGGGTGTVVGSATTTNVFVITGTKTLTGCASVKWYTIGVKPVPQPTIVSLPSTVCAGSSVSLTVQSNTSASYLWQGGQQGSVAVYSPTIQTSYSVFVTGINGCTNTAAATVGVYSLPTLNISSLKNELCTGESTTLTAAGALTYTWSSVGFSGNTSVVVYTAVAGNVGTNSIFLTGTDSNGCTAVSTHTLSVNICVSIQHVKNRFGIKTYPSPASGFVLTENLPVRAGNCTILLLNNAGQVVVKEKVEGTQHKTILDTLRNGIYFVQVYSENGLIYSEKLLLLR